jgi:hypothetical protein
MYWGGLDNGGPILKPMFNRKERGKVFGEVWAAVALANMRSSCGGDVAPTELENLRIGAKTGQKRVRAE